MPLSSELDVLLATAREISRARQDAHHQIGQLEDALTQAREGLKHTNALAVQITRRLRDLGRRQGLLPPAVRAGTLELAQLAALTSQGLAAKTGHARASNVVPLRANMPAAAADPKPVASQSRCTAKNHPAAQIQNTAQTSPRRPAISTHDLSAHPHDAAA